MVKAKKKTKKSAKERGRIDKSPKLSKPAKPVRNKKGQLVSGWGRGSKQVKKEIEAKKKPARRANGTLLPGSIANPEGKTTPPSRIEDLKIAIRQVEEKKDKTFLVMCIEKAWTDTAMAIAILRKLHPDLKAIEMLAHSTDVLDDEEAEEIRKQKQKEFNAIMGHAT